MFTKVLKISARSIHLLVELILIVFIFIAFAIQTFAFQTWLAQKAAAYFSDEWNTEVQIEKVQIIFFDQVEISGVYVEDLHQDTLLYSQNLLVSIDDWSISESFVEIGGVDLKYSRVNLKIYEGEEDMNFQFIADYFATDEPPEETEPFRVNVKRIGIDYINFSFNDENEPPVENGMDFNHLNIDYLKGEFYDFGSDDGRLFAGIKNLVVIDQSGFEIKKLTTEFEMNEKGIFMKPFTLHIKNTKLNTAYLNLEYEDSIAFDDFTNKVIFGTDILNSTIHLSDIAYFVPDLWGTEDVLNLSGQINGPINNLKIRNLDLSTLDLTHLKADIDLPNFDQMEDSPVFLNIKSFTTSSADLKKLRLPPYDTDNYLELPEALNYMGVINLSAQAIGLVNDFMLTSEINTQIGKTNIKLNMKKPEETPYEYKGKIETYALNLGLLAQDPSLGKITGVINFDGSGFEEKNLRVKLDNSVINSVGYNQYVYSNIKLKKALLTARDFKGHLEIKDKYIDVDFNGYLNFAGKKPGGQFKLDVNKAFLTKVNILEGDPNLNFKLYSTINFTGIDPDEIFGKVDIDTFYYYDSSRVYDFNTVSISRSENLELLKVESGLFDLRVDGKFNAQHFSGNMINSLSQVMPNIFFREKIETPEVEEHFTFNLHIKDFDYISSIFIPELKIESNTMLSGQYFADDDLFKMQIISGLISYEEYRFDRLVFSSALAKNHLDINCQLNRIVLNDSLHLPNFKLTSMVEDNAMKTTILWDSTDQMKDAYLNFEGNVDSNSVYYMDFKSSYFHIQEDKWDISEKSFFKFDTSSINVSDFALTQNKQRILMNGTVSENPQDRLNFDIIDFDLNYITTLFGLDNEFDGILNGEGYLADPYNQFIFGAVNEIKELKIDQNLVGDINFSQIYDSEDEVFDIGGNIVRDDRKTFDYEGTIDFNNTENQLDLNMIFDKIDISFINAFVEEEDYSNIMGILDGNISVKGMFDAPKLKGDINFLSGNVKVGMLGVNFGFGGKIVVRDGMIALNNLPVYDEDGNSGKLIATLFHDNFTNWSYDVFLDLENSKRFKVMDTKYKEGEYYYGTAYINGVAGVSGDEKDLYIDVTATTKEDTRLIMPLTGPTQVAEQDFMVFINNDSVANQIKDDYDLTGVHMNINIDVTKQAEFKLVFDESTGDVITAACEGPMNIIIDKYGNLKIYGSLVIARGDYLFGMSNVVSKSFTIVPGGTIDWIGDPYNANINISTIYQARAPMKGLMSGLVGPGEIEKYATPEIINCILTLEGTLMEPTFAFDIEAPRADDQARSALQRVKKTDDELKKQFFSLLLLNKFIPMDGSSSGGGAGGAGTSAVSEMISNQLSNLLSQMSEEYQIGVKYANDQESHSNELEVGVSTELLNDKLVISGSVGVANTTATGESASSIIGDINVEYKLNRDGTFTVAVFNESNEFDVTKSTLGRFTQGFGVNYKESFQTVAEFELVQTFLNIFRKKENRWSPPEDDRFENKIKVPEKGKEDEVIDEIIKNS